MKFKILGVILLVIISLFIIPQNTFAETPYSSSYQTPTTDANVPRDLNTYSQSVLIELSTAAICQMYGVNPVKSGAKCLGVNPDTGKIGFVENGGGMIGLMGNMITSLFYIPVNPGEYFHYMAGSFVGNKKTYAAQENMDQTGGGTLDGTFCDANKPNSCCNGSSSCQYTCDVVDPVGGGGSCRYIGSQNSSVNVTAPVPPENLGGFAGLKPFATIWLKFTQVVFLFYVAIFMLVGFGIMFRLPVDQRAVMSIQNQLPKIIISIVLIFFSFAIAGFLVDFMYLIIFLLFGLVNSISGVNITDMNPAQLQGSNPFGLVGGLGGVGGIASNASGSVGGVIKGLFDSGPGSAVATVLGALLGAAAGTAIPVPIVGNLVGGVLGGVITHTFGVPGADKILGLLGSMIAFLIIGFALISALFRLWFKLLQAYILFLFNVILAPFWIMGGVIPGMKFGFGSWLKSCIGHLSVFPTTVTMFLIGKVIMDAVKSSGNSFFVPPLIGSSIGANDIATLIGLGVILSTPSIVDNVKKGIGATGIGASSLGESLSFGQNATGILRKRAIGTVWKKDQMGHPKGVLNYRVSKTLDNWNKIGGTRGLLAKGGRLLNPYDKATGRPYADTPTQSAGVQRELNQIRGTQPQGVRRFIRRNQTAPQPLPGGVPEITNQIDSLTQDFAGDKDLDKAMQGHLRTIRQQGNNLSEDDMNRIKQDIQDRLMAKTNQQLAFLRNRDPQMAQDFEDTRAREQGNHKNLKKLTLLGQRYMSNPNNPHDQEELTTFMNTSAQQAAAQQQANQQQQQQQQTAQVAAQNQAVKNQISGYRTTAPTATNTNGVTPEEINQLLDNLDAAYEEAEGDQQKLALIKNHLQRLAQNGFNPTTTSEINTELRTDLNNRLQTTIIPQLRRQRVSDDLVNQITESARKEQVQNPNDIVRLIKLNKLGTQLNQNPTDQSARTQINELARDINRKYDTPRVNNFKTSLQETIGHLSAPSTTPSHLPNDAELNRLIQTLETRVNDTANPFPIEKVEHIQGLLDQLNNTTTPVNAADIDRIKNDIRSRLS